MVQISGPEPSKWQWYFIQRVLDDIYIKVTHLIVYVQEFRIIILQVEIHSGDATIMDIPCYDFDLFWLWLQVQLSKKVSLGSQNVTFIQFSNHGYEFWYLVSNHTNSEKVLAANCRE